MWVRDRLIIFVACHLQCLRSTSLKQEGHEIKQRDEAEGEISGAAGPIYNVTKRGANGAEASRSVSQTGTHLELISSAARRLSSTCWL